MLDLIVLAFLCRICNGIPVGGFQTWKFTFSASEKSGLPERVLSGLFLA